MPLLRMHVLCNSLFRPAVSWNKIREDECRAPVCIKRQVILYLAGCYSPLSFVKFQHQAVCCFLFLLVSLIHLNSKHVFLVSMVSQQSHRKCTLSRVICHCCERHSHTNEITTSAHTQIHIDQSEYADDQMMVFLVWIFEHFYF